MAAMRSYLIILLLLVSVDLGLASTPVKHTTSTKSYQRGKTTTTTTTGKKKATSTKKYIVPSTTIGRKSSTTISAVSAPKTKPSYYTASTCQPITKTITSVSTVLVTLTTTVIATPSAKSSVQAVYGVLNWKFFGCYTNEITYSLAIEVDVVKNLDSCQAYCSGRSYAYFGVQGDDQKCFCGGSLDATPGMPTPTRYCNVVCSGNSTQFCGGKGTLSVYQNPVNSNPYGPPTGKDIISKQLSSPWKSLGCYSVSIDSIYTLSGIVYNDFIYIGSSAMTLETCQAYCGNMGYHFAGVYQSEFCSCDDTVFSQSFPLNSAMNCTLPCTGDVAQLCGGDHGISIYTSPTTTTDNLPAINATDAMQSVQKAPWTLAGCYTDQAFPNRALTGLSIGGDSFNGYNFLTNQECQAYCGALGFTFAGSEAGFACLCGNSISDTSIAHDMEYCYWPCWGNSNETCGGGWATQIYINPNPSIPLPLNFVSSIDIMTAAYAANWTDVGCYMDNGSGVLNGFSGLFENVITQENCLAFCLHNKFMYAGLELGTTCFCANEIEGTAKLASSAKCQTPCNGNTYYEMCGGNGYVDVWKAG